MTTAISSAPESALTTHRFFLLFVLLLGTLCLYPYSETPSFGYYAFRIVAASATLISVYAAKIHRGLLVLAILLAIPTLFQRILLHATDLTSLSVVRVVLSFLFDLLIVVVIFRHVFARDRISSETIFGALCIYLLVGFSFAGLYGMVSDLQSKAFFLDPSANLHAVPNRFDFIYYSFTTMTSLGAAGMIPVSPAARSITILETIFGGLYLAVLIARLIGAYRPNPSSATSTTP
ncbi:MAG: ion channel [Candidatus Acidiferrum sp.]|jgi:hypothetical protein